MMIESKDLHQHQRWRTMAWGKASVTRRPLAGPNTHKGRIFATSGDRVMDRAMSATTVPNIVPPSPSHAAFKSFREQYAARPPAIASRNADEVVQMMGAHGLRLVDHPQAEPNLVEEAPANDQDAKHHRYLWVVGVAGVPYAPEDCEFGEGLTSGVIKHTNLTGGADAHCAGEAWFVADDQVIINGSSGRYGPKDEAQLRAAGLALKQCGYKVAMIGFDETNKPAIIVVGQEDLEWL